MSTNDVEHDCTPVNGNPPLAESGRNASCVSMQEVAIDLCRKVKAICPAYGCHVALTSGCLYKDGEKGIERGVA